MFQELHFAIQVLPFIVISFDKCRKMEFFSVKGLLHLKYERPDTVFYSNLVYFNIVWFKKIGEIPINHFFPLKFQDNAVC